jgi:hypothetical protein
MTRRTADALVEMAVSHIRAIARRQTGTIQVDHFRMDRPGQ